MQWDAVDAFDWASVHDAYGSADYVPEMLRDLLSDDPGAQDRAWESLYVAILHQGSVHTATVALIPFLIEMLPEVDQPERVLVYLAQIGEAQERMKYLEQYIEEGKAWAERELTQTKLALKRLPDGIPVYTPFLKDADEEVQKAALILLAWCGEGAVDPLVAFIRRGGIPSVSLALAFLALGRTAPSPLSVFEEGMVHSSQLVQLAACFGFILASRGQISEAVYEKLFTLLDGTEAYRALAGLMAFYQSALGTPDAYLQPLSQDHAQKLMTTPDFPLLHALESLEEEADAARHLTDYCLPILFKQPPYDRSITRDALNENQLRFLHALLASEAAWVSDGNLKLILLEQGLRFCDGRASLARFLGESSFTRVMVVDSSWSPAAEEVCKDLGRPSWLQMPFIFFLGDTGVLDELIPEDPADFPPSLMADAKQVAGRLFRDVIKPASPDLTGFRFYAGKTTEEMKAIALAQGWEVLDPPEKMSLQKQDDPTQDLSMQAAMGWDDLQVWQKEDLGVFVQSLDAAGWLEAKHWHTQLVNTQTSLVPIGFARYINPQAFLELQLWFYDDAIAALTGKRTGFQYLKLVVIGREATAKHVFRLFYQRNLAPVLEKIIFHQDAITVENVVELVILPSLDYLIDEKAVLDLGDLKLVKIGKKEQDGA